MGEPSRMVFPVGAASLALLVIVPATLLIGRHGFDGLYGQDAFAYVGYALGPLRDALLGLRLPPAFFWPPGFPLLVSSASIALGWGDPAGQAVSLAAGSLVPVFVALLARDLAVGGQEPRERLAVPLLAGAVAALSGQLWQSSVVAMSDTTGAAAATAGAWAACRYAATGRARWLALAAAALGFAIEVRWVYGLVAAPLGVATLIAIRRLNREDLHARVRDLGLGAVIATIVVLPTAVPMLTALAGGVALPFAADFDTYHWDPANAMRRSFVTLDGRLDYELPTGIFYLMQPIQPYWFWALGLLAVPGLIGVLRRATVTSGAVLVAWPALVVGFLLGGGYQNTRFFLAAMPPVAILVAIGAAELWRAARDAPAGWWRPIAPRAAAALVAIGLVANGLYAARFTDAFIERQSRDLAAIRALEARVPSDARLISLGATPALEHDGLFDVVELYWLDADSVLELTRDGRPSYLLVDVASIRQQWQGRGPGLAVAALEAGPGLEPVAAAGSWTLYRVGSSG